MSKQDENKRAEAEINRIRKLPDNKNCANCLAPGTPLLTAVVMPFKIFVCSNCKSAHQAFSHRCKSTQMSLWTMEEVKSLEERSGGGNKVAQDTWLYHAKPGDRPRDGDKLERYKDFVKRAYCDERFKGSGGGGGDRRSRREDSPPPRDNFEVAKRRPLSGERSSGPAGSRRPLSGERTNFNPSRPAPTTDLLFGDAEPSSASSQAGAFNPNAPAGGAAPFNPNAGAADVGFDPFSSAPAPQQQAAQNFFPSVAPPQPAAGGIPALAQPGAAPKAAGAGAGEDLFGDFSGASPAQPSQASGGFNPNAGGGFNPNAGAGGSFNPNAGAGGGGFNPNAGASGGFNPNAGASGGFNPNGNGSFNPNGNNADFGAFNSASAGGGFNPNAGGGRVANGPSMPMMGGGCGGCGGSGSNYAALGPPMGSPYPGGMGMGAGGMGAGGMGGGMGAGGMGMGPGAMGGMGGMAGMGGMGGMPPQVPTGYAALGGLAAQAQAQPLGAQPCAGGFGQPAMGGFQQAPQAAGFGQPGAAFGAQQGNAFAPAAPQAQKAASVQDLQANLGNLFGK